MLSIRNSDSPVFGSEPSRALLEQLIPGLRATICVAQNALAFESLKPKCLLHQTPIPFFNLFAQRLCALLEGRNEMFTSNKIQNQARHRIALILTFVGLMNTATLLLKPSISSAQANLAILNRWTTNGPDGGSVLALAIDRSNPATLYAGTYNGVFKSIDGGENWTSSLTNASAQIVALAPSTPTTIYAAGSKGVYKSIDGGASWNAINNGLENQNGPIYILALTIDPSNSNIVFAAGPDITDPTVTYKAIYETIDGGPSSTLTKYSY